MKWSKRLPFIALVVQVGIVLIVWLNFRIYLVPLSSMERTLLIGDRILARLQRGTIPCRGEILVFHTEGGLTVKRVVAIAGDRVRIHEKRLFINGKEQNEDYVTHLDPV